MERRPGDEHGWEMWGGWLLATGETEKAVSVLAQAVEVHPRSVRLRYWSARARLFAGRRDEALRDLRELRAAAPDSSFPYLGLASVAVHDEAWDDAARFVHQAEDLGAPRDPEALRILYGIVLDLPGERSWAVDLLRRACRSRREPLPHLILAVLLEGGSPQEAARHLASARRYSKKSRTAFQADIEDLRERFSGLPD